MAYMAVGQVPAKTMSDLLLHFDIFQFGHHDLGRSIRFIAQSVGSLDHHLLRSLLWNSGEEADVVVNNLISVIHASDRTR